MPISTCTVSGNVKDLLGQNVSGVTIRVYAVKPFFHTASLISGQVSSTTSDANGDWELAVIETETVGYKLTFSFEYSNGAGGRQNIKYAVMVPDDATVEFSDLIAQADGPAVSSSFPASLVSVVATGNLISTNAQAALEELQDDIDAINTLADGKIYLGNASNQAAEVTLTGDVTVSNTGVTAISPGVVVNADISASASIQVSKLQPLTVSRAIQSDAGGLLTHSSVTSTELGYVSGVTSAIQTQLDAKIGTTLNDAQVLVGNSSNVATARTLTGDVTVSNTGVTAIGAGVIVNADINASANIADTKLDTIATAGKVSNSATTATSSNTASAIVARDGSGNFSAGTITAALTGTASGNTTYTPNQYGVVLSGSGNTMSVLAPDASTTKVLTSGGTSANPSWQPLPSSTSYIVGSAYLATTASSTLIRANADLGAFGDNANCPGPTVEYNDTSVGTIQTTDTNNAIFTVNSLLAGKYEVTIMGRAFCTTGNGAAFAINDGTDTRGFSGFYYGSIDTYLPFCVTAYFEYGSGGNKSFQLYGACTGGNTVTVDFTDGLAKLWFGIKRVG